MNESELDEHSQAQIVTIDGPAGAGKSSIARRLAERIGFEFLDTGAMYRAVAWAMLSRKIDPEDTAAVAQLAHDLRIDQSGMQTLVNGEDVSAELRTNAVTESTRYVADNPGVRAVLVKRQREIAAGRAMVCEGRDQGSVVFPRSPCKIYLTATPEERARRRQLDLEGQNETVEYEQLLRQINDRDDRDSAREVGPLVKPPGAIEVLTDGLSIEQVIDRLEAIVRERIK